MSTNRFSHFSFFFASFCIGHIGHQHQWVKNQVCFQNNFMQDGTDLVPVVIEMGHLL